MATVYILSEGANQKVSDVVDRKLAAILVTDMVGFSRLMEREESGTISRQKLHRSEMIDPKIAQFHGRIVKTTGDSLLVEFVSVVDAVKCAIAIQKAVKNREADSPEATRIQYRIGINLGDVVIEDDDIFGDGVNVAAPGSSIRRQAETANSSIPTAKSSTSTLAVIFNRPSSANSSETRRQGTVGHDLM